MARGGLGLAEYKGVRVAVYVVDKNDVNLTRQDLVQLVNVPQPYIRLLLMPPP